MLRISSLSKTTEMTKYRCNDDVTTGCSDVSRTTCANDEWSIRSMLSTENTSLQRVMVFYVLVFILTFGFVYFICCIKAWSSIVISLIISQVYLNAICSPIRIDMWSEFDSYVGLYGLIQVGTPLVVFVYAVAAALKDTDRAPRKHRPRAVVLEPPTLDD